MSKHSRINPAVALAAMGVLLAACSPASDGTGTGASSSSSVPAMMPSSANTMMPSSAPAMMKSSEAAAMMQKYADGTYAAVGSYVSPAGQEAVDVSITLKNGVIASATFQGEATHPTSKRMQENFGKGYQELVVGKSIDDVSLTVVNGSSLTSKGFMDALAKIKVEASA